VPKKRRQARIPTPDWEPPRGTIGSRVLGRGFQFYGAVVIAILLMLGLGIAVYAFGADELEKRGRPGSTAIKVEDTRFRLDYFSRRMKMFVDQNGGQGAVPASSALPAVSSLLIQEEIVRLFAGEMDVAATDEEITGRIATGLGITADDESFDLVFQQELARTEVSETDYRLMIEAGVLTDKLQEIFLAGVPDSAESVRYRQILVSEQNTAQDVKQQIEAGADFAALVTETPSLDPTTRNSGGEVGWVPRGARPVPLDASTEALVFDLEPGAVDIIEIAPSVILVVEMLEKEDDRPLDDAQKSPLAVRALGDWVAEKQESLSVVNNMEVDSDKVEWAVRQAYQS
jgi:hypothetical protein